MHKNQNSKLHTFGVIAHFHSSGCPVFQVFPSFPSFLDCTLLFPSFLKSVLVFLVFQKTVDNIYNNNKS